MTKADLIFILKQIAEQLNDNTMAQQRIYEAIDWIRREK